MVYLFCFVFCKLGSEENRASVSCESWMHSEISGARLKGQTDGQEGSDGGNNGLTLRDLGKENWGEKDEGKPSIMGSEDFRRRLVAGTTNTGEKMGRSWGKEISRTKNTGNMTVKWQSQVHRVVGREMRITKIKLSSAQNRGWWWTSTDVLGDALEGNDSEEQERASLASAETETWGIHFLPIRRKCHAAGSLDAEERKDEDSCWLAFWGSMRNGRYSHTVLARGLSSQDPRSVAGPQGRPRVSHPQPGCWRNEWSYKRDIF